MQKDLTSQVQNGQAKTQGNANVIKVTLHHNNQLGAKTTEFDNQLLLKSPTVSDNQTLMIGGGRQAITTLPLYGSTATDINDQINNYDDQTTPILDAAIVAGDLQSQPSEVNVGTTQQEAQTSFRPSIRDSLEFKKISESILKLSLDKNEEELQSTNQHNYLKDIIRANQQFYQNNQHFPGQVGLVNQEQQQQVQQTTIQTQNLSTRRHKSQRGSNSHSEHTQVLPRSGVHTARISASNLKVEHQVSKSTASKNQQVLRQIYISVNTYDENKFMKDQQIQQQDNNQMLNQASQGKSNQVVQQHQHHQPQNRNSLAVQAQAMTLKRRRTSRERAVDALLRVNGGQQNPNGSLIIQPMLLGVKAFSRTKNPNNNPGSQQQSFGPGAYIGGISSGQQSPMVTANMQSQQHMQNFTEYVFDNQIITGKKERPTTKRPQTHHNNKGAARKNNMKVKVKNERKRASFSQHDTMMTQQQVCQTINCPGNINNSARSDQYQQAVQGNRSLSGGEQAEIKKLQFVIGPQVVQSLSSEQAAAVEASGAQTIPTRLTPNNDQMYFGQPIIIDADSKLGKHFLEENRQRKKFEDEQNDLNRKRLTEKWNREKKDRYFGYLTDNQMPKPHINAPIIDKKVTAQMKKEDDARNVEFQRGIIWNQYQKEILEKQSQAMSSKQTMHVEKRFSQKPSSDLYLPTPTPNLNGDAASEPKTDLMTPWSNRDVHSAMLADEDVKVDSTHDQQWTERPSTQMRMNSQTSPPSKEREKTNDSRMAAIQIAKVAEMARQMNPNNFHEIQNIIYKTLNQTDILNQPELINTLVVGSEHDKNPNAIVIRTSDLSQIAPILQQKSQTAGVINHSQQQQISQPTTQHDDLVLTMTQDMNIEQFTESIKKMYLPFTLRKMYYKELLLRKPLFLGHSKKGVGFSNKSGSLLNERTCLAQHNQQLHREMTATISPHQSLSPVGRDDSILKVGQAPLNQAKDKFAQNLSPGFQKGRQCLSMQRQGYYKLNGDQAVQQDEKNDRALSRNKGIDMQSFGAMTGVDQGAVREIEQLIQLQQTSHTDLRAVSTANRKNDLSIANMASGALTIEERGMVESGGDTKKSKVIFSVKKDQPHNLSFTRNRDEAVSNYQSKAKRLSNSKAYSSIDTGHHRGSVPASSAQSQPSSNKQYHELLHPRGKVSSPAKLSPDKKQSLQIAPNRNFLQVQTKTDAAKDIAMNQSSSGRNFIKAKTAPIRQTDPQRKNQTQHQSMNKKKNFELQYQTHLNSMHDEQLETARTPTIVDLHHDESLKNVNVSNVKIMVSKDSAMSAKGRAIGEQHGLRSQSNSPDTNSQNRVNLNGMPQQSSYLRSFTCADLNKRDLVQLGLKRRIRSAKNGDKLYEMKITPDVEQDSVKQGGIQQPDQKADAMRLNANSQSNFGRINLELIKHTRPEQHVPANFTQPDQQNNNTLNLPQQIQWMNQAPQDDIAETGSPKEQIIDPNQQQMFEYMCYDLRNQTTSPKILNLHLNDAATFSPQRYPNQLPVSIPNSIKQSVKRKTENTSKANEAVISPNSSSLQNGTKLSKTSKLYNSLARKATNSAQQSQARSPGVPVGDRRSRGSFYISEDSQRTLTPLSCKEDQNGHVQGQVVHRGNKLSQMHKLRHRGQSVRHNKSPSRLSEQQRDSIQMRNQQLRANKVDCTVQAQESHDTQTPQCTCSLKGSYKLDQLLLAEKQNSIDTQNSKNRVVFVVHNDDKKTDPKVAFIKEKNSDLAHLPQIESSEATSGDTGIIKIHQVENSQAIVATASKAKQREKIEPIRLENNALKKSASNNHYGDQNPVKRIVASSFSNEEMQDNRMHRTQDIISAASKQMSPQSSSILPLGQILPAVNSQEQSSYNQVINESYTELIQLKKPAQKEKKEEKPKQAKPTAEPKVVPKIQVKMRMSKNPNQCPPKMTARKRNNSILRAQSLKNASAKQKATEQFTAANSIISIQVQNDKTQKAEEEQKKKSETFINPNFSSLQPFEIMTTDDLTNQVLTLVEENEKSVLQKEEADQTKVVEQVTVKDQIMSDKRTSLLTLNASIAQLTNRQKRPQSQHSTGNQRFNRLQQLYSTQRGRNIASLVNSTTASKNIKNFNNQNAVKDNSDVTLTKKKSDTLTHHQRNNTTMDSVNRTLKITAADPINRQNLAQQSTVRMEQNQTDLRMIGRTATLRSSNDFVQIIKGNRLGGGKHQSGQLGGKVDVGQSIQRFSIHLSPRNQILAIREQHGEKECLLHKTLPLSRLQYNESLKHIDTSPDRTVTPLHHFLPTLPENQSIKGDNNTKAVNTKNSSRQESTSQAFQFSQPQSMVNMTADQQPQITYVSNLTTTNKNNFQHVTTSHHSTHNSFSNHVADKIGGGTLQKSAHLTAEPSARPQEFNTIQQSEFEQNLGKASKTRGIKRPMTCAKNHNKMNKRSEINQSATIDNALSSTLSGGTKRGEPFLTMQNRIVRGLASRHKTANLMATSTGQETAATAGLLQQTRPQTGVLATRHKKSKSSTNTVAAFGSKKQRFTYNNNRPAPLNIRDEVHQLQSNYLESNVTLKTPVVNSKVNMFDRQTTGSIVNSMAELQNMAGQGRQHTRTLSQDLVQLIGRDKMMKD